MRAIIAFCLIAICLGATNENQSFFSKVLNKVQDIKRDMVEDVASLRNSTFDAKKVLAETIRLAKDLTHIHGENTESVFGEDSLKTVQRVHNFNKKVLHTVAHTASNVKNSISANMLVANMSTIANDTKNVVNATAHKIAESNVTKAVVNATVHAANATKNAVNATMHKIAESNVTKAVVNATVHAANATKNAVNATMHKIAESNVTKAVVNATKHAANATKHAVNSTYHKIANSNVTKKAVNATKHAANATKHAVNATYHKIADSNATKKAVNATKKAVNATVAVAKAAMNKTSAFLKGLVSHNMLNAEEKQTLAQKIAEKSKALLAKAKETATHLKNKVHHHGHENSEHSFGEHVMIHAKAGAHKAHATAKNLVAKVANTTAAQTVVNATKTAFNATKTVVNATAHKVAESNVTKAVVNATKNAANATVAVAKAALNKTSAFIKGLVSHNMLNAEEKQTLAQKIAEKSKALLTKAKETATHLSSKIHHHGHENSEHSFGEHVMIHAKEGAHKVHASTHKALNATKNAVHNIWTKLAGF